jgi:hypothetical protein
MSVIHSTSLLHSLLELEQATAAKRRRKQQLLCCLALLKRQAAQSKAAQSEAAQWQHRCLHQVTQHFVSLLESLILICA